jgi:hypothetical protein
MKVRRTVPPLLIIFLLTIASTRPSSSAIALEQGASARGEGEFFNEFTHELFHFSFDVRANKKGNTHGRAEFDNLTAGTQVVVKVDCLRVEFSEALITGTVLHSNDPDFPKHANVIFDATDGQLFSPIRQDTITPLFVSTFTDCHDASSPLTIFQVGDSIQIDPGSE